jgi:catechol 2,3-dioxygenase-like lactoylglutathione lyase family enzyme
MAASKTTRAGAILAVADVEASVGFDRDRLGFELEASYDDPPYATLALAGARLSLAEQGHEAEDRPGVAMLAPEDRSRLQVALVLEVTDCRGAYEELSSGGVEFLAEPFSPPWGGARCFAVDPDGYLVELEEPA